MKQVLLLISIVLLFFTVNTEAQLKPAQSQYLVEKGVLINPSFEQGYKGWVITGCTKSLVTETPYLDKSLKLTCTNETFSIKQVSASLIDFKNQQGAFDLQIKTTASGVNVASITNGVRDNSYTVISDTTFKRFKEIGFIIGDTDNGIEVYSDTNFTGEIIVDNFKLGLGNLTQEISGAHFVGSLTWRNSSCFWDNNLSVYSSFGANNSCDPASKNGLLEPLTKVPAAIIPNARTDAEYMIEVQGNFLVSAATSCAYDLKVNGVQLNSDTQIFDAQWGNSLKNTVRFNTGGNKEIEIIYKKTSGVGSCQIYADAESGSRALTFIVHAFPDSKNTIVSQKSQSPNYAGFLSFSFMDGDLQGHLPADGRCVAKNLYPDYDKRVANLYGDCDAGTGANTGYNLPDMRGYFPRMVDTTSEGTAGVNPDNTLIGGVQADQLESHNHPRNTSGVNENANVFPNIGNQVYSGAYTSAGNQLSNFSTTGNRGGNETRPSAISLMAYVRMADNNLVVGSFEQIRSDDLRSARYTLSSTASIPSSDTVVKYLTKDRDLYSDYNTTSGEYLVAKDGNYSIGSSVTVLSNDSEVYRIDLRVNGTVIKKTQVTGSRSNQDVTVSVNEPSVKLSIGDIVTTFLSTSSGSKVHNNTSFENVFTIQELPDRQSIVANLMQGQTTKCQTKFLQANTNSNGVLADLTFNNLKTDGTKYRLCNLLDAQFAAGDNIALRAINNGVIVADRTVSLGSVSGGSVQQGYLCVTIVPTASILTHDIVSLSPANTVRGDGAIGETFAELCELPDTVIETTEFN